MSFDSLGRPPPDAPTSSSSRILGPSVWRKELLRPAALCILLLTLEILALVYDLDAPTTKRATSESIAQIAEAKRSVRHKLKGTIAWIDSRAGESLHSADSVLTLTESNASVRFADGSLLKIEPESLVVLDPRASAKGGFAGIQIELVEGSIERKDAGKLPLAVDVRGKDGKISRIEDKSGSASFSIRRGANGEAEVNVIAGNLEIVRDGRHETIRTSEKRILAERAGAAFALESFHPKDASVVARDPEEDQKIELGARMAGAAIPEKARWAWTWSHDGSSDPEELEDATWSKDPKPEARQEVAPLSRSGTLHWRLDALERQGDSETWITLAQGSLKLLRRRPPEPIESEARVRRDKSIALSWREPASECSGVRVEWSRSQDFTGQVFSKEVDRSISSAQFQEKKPGKWFWRLRGSYGTEGVSPPSETREIIVEDRKPPLPPKVKRARARLEHSSFFQKTEESLVISATKKKLKSRAPASAEPQVALELRWEKSEEAARYRVQVSRTRDFQSPLIDHVVEQLRDTVRVPAKDLPAELFYRVAGVNDENAEGEFSKPASIDLADIHAELNRQRLAAEGEAPEQPSSEQIESRARLRVEIFGAAAYHSRDLKSDLNPKTAKGLGLIPMGGGFEIKKLVSEDPTTRADPKYPGDGAWSLVLGGVALAEKGEPTTLNVKPQGFDLLFARGWVGLERMSGSTLGFGLYSATTNKLRWSGRAVVSDRVIAIGASAWLASAALAPRSWHWRAGLGATGLGAIGGDATLAARKYIWSNGASRAIDVRGMFGELELFGRWMTKETSWAGSFRLGVGF